MPENEIGQFYSEDCYLFVCKYWKIDESLDAGGGGGGGGEGENHEEAGEEEMVENTIELKLYFWQGRDANNAGWLTYTFTLKKKFKDIDVIKFNQQQESPQFLAHFKRKFIIHKGKRKPHALHVSQHAHNTNSTDATTKSAEFEPKMYHLRKNPYSAICTRCIQLDTADAANLCSEFCYILCVPFENAKNDDYRDSNLTKGIVYVWIGNEANPDEARLAEEIAQYMYDVSNLFHIYSFFHYKFTVFIMLRLI